MKRHVIQIISILLLLHFTNYAFAKENNILSQNPGEPTDTGIVVGQVSNDTRDNTSDAMNQPNGNNWPTPYTLVAFIGIPIGTLVYGMATWNWGEEDGFHVRHEGFFGQNTANGGADKVGHAFSHYLAFRIMHNYYDWSENGKNTRWFYSITTAAALGLMIEVGDAYTSEYGFSYEDLISDLSGITLGIILEYSPTLDSLIGYSWQYIPTSRFYKKQNEKPINFTTDYNGSIFVLNFRLAGLQNLGLKLPKFLRYIQFDFGYFTRNYRSGDVTDEGPYRSLYYGVSLNFMEIVKDFFDNPETRASRILQQPFKYYHIPAGYHEDYKI